MIWSDHYNRFVPEIGPEHYRSYSLAAPLSSHWKKATCEEYECDEFVYGYVLTVDTSTEMGKAQYYYLTHDNTRKYSKQNPGQNIWKFVYGPGNDGMGAKHADHRVPVGRPPFLLVAEGDFRGNPRRTPIKHHRYMDDWIDEFATQLDTLATAYNRG